MTTASTPLPPPHFRRGARPDAHQARRAATVVQLAAGLSGRALDYGAGWGDLTARLAPQFSEIEGVDVGTERVEFAAAEYAPIRFAQCPTDGLDYADASFDAVFSTVVLHFVPSPEHYLAECHRVLRPGGELVVTIQNPDSMWMTLSRLRKPNRGAPGWSSGSSNQIKVWDGTLATFRDWLTAQGFAIESHAGFYDPPLDRIRTPADVVLAALNTTGHVLSLPGRWSYVGFRCRRVS